MEKNYVDFAEEYYMLVGQKNAAGIEKYLHTDVEFYSPLATLKGKEAVIQATSGFMNVIESLTIRSKFGMGDQAIIVYDSDISGIAKGFPGASLLSFRDGLIIRIELFHDARRFVESGMRA